MRQVKIYTTNGSAGSIDTDVRTLGELLPLLRQREISTEGMKMLEGATKNELSLDEAVLPVGDFKLYLMPAKTKSGSANQKLAELFKEIAEIYEDMDDEEVDYSDLNLDYTPRSTRSFEDEEAMEEIRNLQKRS